MLMEKTVDLKCNCIVYGVILRGGGGGEEEERGRGWGEGLIQPEIFRHF